LEKSLKVSRKTVVMKYRTIPILITVVITIVGFLIKRKTAQTCKKD